MRRVSNITAIADPEPNKQTRRVLTEFAAESMNYTPKSDPPPGGPILPFFAILCPAPSYLKTRLVKLCRTQATDSEQLTVHRFTSSLLL